MDLQRQGGRHLQRDLRLLRHHLDIYDRELGAALVQVGSMGDVRPDVGGTPSSSTAVRQPRRYAFRRLTVKLGAGVAALVAVLILVPGGVTYVKIRQMLNGRLNEQVLAAASGSLYRILNGSALGPSSPQTVWFAELGPGGQVLDHFPVSSTVANIRHMNLSPRDRARLSSPTRTFVDVSTADGYHLRVVSEVQVGIVGVIVIGLSTESVTNTLHELIVVELCLSLFAIALGACTILGVSRSLRPIKRLSSTARDIATELSPDGAGLSRRAEVMPREAGSEAGSLTDAVNVLLDAVETQFSARVESESRMRQFLADASHELRTPLTSIRGYAELARMKRQAGVPDDGDALVRIEAEGIRMANLVEELLMLARGDSAIVPDRRAVEVKGLISDVVDATAAAYPSRNVEALCQPYVYVRADYDQIRRALLNLTTNAALHTSAEGRIAVSARVEQEMVVIDVRDEGPGLTPEAAAHVFERFWRADESRIRSTGGSGLGMSIVQSIANAHGGTVSFASSPATGSTVTIALPLAT
jgi:two-component system OmpR family sensor kinase